MTKGCVAAGSQQAVNAGLYAFKKGGNAIDALIASQLTATVAEPLLTGLGGAGIACIKAGNQYQSIDMFTAMPGLGRPNLQPPLMNEVYIDFGPTRQRFNVGLGSVAVPSLAKGLVHLHRKYSSLPMKTLAAPAIDCARNGFVVTAHFEKVIELLWPICQQSAEMEAMFSGKQGRLRAGELYAPKGMVADLKEFVELGPDFMIKGRLGESLRRMIKANDNITLNINDIDKYSIQENTMRKTMFKNGSVYTSRAPSIGGSLIDKNLSQLDKITLHDQPFGLKQMQTMIDVQSETARQRNELDYIEEILGESNKYLNLNNNNKTIGNTTHVSVVDGDGFAAGLTSSLGETCGLVVSGSQMLLNNFLGESDVAPVEATRHCGGRLVTMCSPSILESRNGIYVMGSGGSSRIPTAVLHGILYLHAYGLSVEDAVAAPRLHVEGDQINVESDGRDVGVLQQLCDTFKGRVKIFDGPNMYFGGLHIASNQHGRLKGFGDPRRSGSVGCS